MMCLNYRRFLRWLSLNLYRGLNGYPQYAESYMKKKSENEAVEIDVEGLEKAKELFNNFKGVDG